VREWLNMKKRDGKQERGAAKERLVGRLLCRRPSGPEDLFNDDDDDA
jgi:hypothetical protein